MADFNYTPSSCEESAEFQVDVMRFGDGYSQRSPQGINNGLRNWEVSFDDISLTDADAIVNFFRAKMGSVSFTFRPTGYAVDVHVVCPRYGKPFLNRFKAGSMVYSVRASFEETPI